MGNRFVYILFPEKDVVVAVALNTTAGTEDSIGKAAEAVYEAVTGDDIEVDQVQPAD